ncbi:putative asp glu racemase [Phaeomoniella chlamydospora]|uniref:Putative asp glu racemase n=1 Tax=Phaeomoniella chlamydospora TaxID=158046 RepID=A0A0G2HBF9_PHACM|nr:putative asp glu racemase [Phaeomoniella chlamydospora]
MASGSSLKIGILVPSSNTAVEPLTISLLSSLSPNVTVHFSRFTVTQISLSPDALSQFTFDRILAAAQLLADAKVDVIGWSGTSAGWLGFDNDEELCRLITETTGGIPATTSTLALNKAFEKLEVKDFALVTPYIDDVQAKIVDIYTKAGYTVKAESHLKRSENHSIASVDEQTLNSQVAEVMKTDGVKAVTTFCTNLKAAQQVEKWEAEYGVPVLDTVATVVWDCLKIVGWDASRIKGWGKMFEL